MMAGSFASPQTQNHLDAGELFSERKLGNFGEAYGGFGNIEKASFCLIEKMVMIRRVSIEHDLAVVDSKRPKQPGIFEPVQRIVNGRQRNMLTHSARRNVHLLRSHVLRLAAEQPIGKNQALARRTQTNSLQKRCGETILLREFFRLWLHLFIMLQSSMENQERCIKARSSGAF